MQPSIISGVGRKILAYRPKASLRFDFVRSNSLVSTNGTITFTRAGATATRVNEQGLIEVVGVDAPRFDYDPATLACKGLLIEEACTNRLTRSAEFDHVDWIKTRCAVTANQALAPDGTVSMDLVEVTETLPNGAALNQASFVVSGSTRWTLSVYGKRGSVTERFIALNPYDGSRSSRVFFDLLNGVVGTTITDGGFTNLAAKIELYPNDTYRCSFSFTLHALSTTLFGFIYITDADGSYYHTMGQRRFIWGAQLAPGEFSSYIPTTTAAVTRNGDNAAVNDISGFYNASEGTVLVEFRRDIDSLPARLWQFNLNDATSYGDLFLLSAGNYQSLPSVGTIAGANNMGTVHRAAMTLKSNDFTLSVDGSNAAAFGAGALAVNQNKLQLGNSSGIQQLLNGHLRSFVYFPRRLSNAQLQAYSRVGVSS